MTRTDKTAAIAELKETFENNKFFYIADASSMTVAEIKRPYVVSVLKVVLR